MTINWEKLKQYRNGQRSGVGKTFSMLVGVVEYVRDNPGHNVLVVGTSTIMFSQFKDRMKAIAEELHVKVEDEFENALVLNGSHVLFAVPRSGGVKPSKVFVDHAALEAWIKEHA